ncbi:MAG: fatty acyl-AMP ligase, partial [Nannocystaceae bacterium]
VIPVPVYPPMNIGKLDAYIANTTHILRKAGCSLVLTDARVKPILGKLMAQIPSLKAIEVLDKLLEPVPFNADMRPVVVTPDDIAFLQFTSGSTSRPKGVTLTHGNLVANVAAIGANNGGIPIDQARGLSWLPLFHDMGLIGFVFAPVYNGATHVRFISPLLFLKRPAIWLQQISEIQATITFAPNFAYGLATQRVKPAELEGVDMSSLRVAGCGAEPIQYDTLRKFADHYAPYGFRSTAFLPCYGMAEHSLAITFVALEDELEADIVDAEALTGRDAKPASPEQLESGEGTLKVVNCGAPFPGHQLKIVDDDEQTLGDREVGHIRLKGPSIMRGYYEDIDNTAKAFVDGWLVTGDLGYTVAGNLYVCGRSKELIIVNGRNFYPQDIEWQAYKIEGVRKGNAIAFSIHDPEVRRERVILAVESRSEDQGARIRGEILAEVLESMSLRLDEILLLPPGTLPKTSSGKLQRTKAAEMFRNSELTGTSKNNSWQLVKHLATSRWAYVKSALKKR